MTKTDLLKHFNTLTELAAALNISKQAVSNWPEIIPFAQQARLSFLFPEMVQGLVKENGVIEFKIIPPKKKKKAA